MSDRKTIEQAAEAIDAEIARLTEVIERFDPPESESDARVVASARMKLGYAERDKSAAGLGRLADARRARTTESKESDDE